jgi:branched-subunit amino acid aminotransferase/4-amino-4-deoxychorismate lyase
MNTRVSFNHQILSVEKTFISAVSSASLYGKGVFTTIAVYDSKPFLWEKHWRRLLENSKQIGLDLSGLDEKSVKYALSDLILLSNLKTARARVTFFDESASRTWNFETKSKTSFLITIAARQKAGDGYRLTVSPYTVNSKSPLAGIKSCNYLENLLALEEGKKRGFDEVVRLNEKGEIVSAAMANIFWVKGEKIFTPAPETGCLKGTTREFVSENFPVSETVSTIAELAAADEIFLTSAGIGVCPASFENVAKKSSSLTEEVDKLLDLQRLKA